MSQKALVSYVTSVHPSVCMCELQSHWTDFGEIRYWRRL